MMAPRVEVTTLGEALIRLSVRPGDRIQDAPAFDVHVAGSEANVAYALARVGVGSAWASVLPSNPLGERIATTLRSGGVDLAPVTWVEEGRVGTYFVELGSPPRPTMVTYDRAGSTMALASPQQFDWAVVCDTRLLHISGITLGVSVGAKAVALTALAEARARGCRVALDVNYRARLWTPAEAAEALRALAGQVDVVLCKAADAEDLFGCTGEPIEIGRRLQDLFQVRTVAVTCGDQPAVALDGDGSWSCPAHRIDMIDRIGAGDAFAAGVLWGYLEGSVEQGLERGVAMAALKMTLHGDLFTLDRAAVDALLARDGRDVTR